MSLISHQVLKIISSRLSEEQKKGAIIYLDKTVFEAGTDIRIGRSTIPMPFRGCMVFVDLLPRANWGHPTLYFLINDKTQEVEIISDEFPPWEELPENAIVLLRYGKPPPHPRFVNVFDE